MAGAAAGSLREAGTAAASILDLSPAQATAR
jgi:hypothetical protein